MCESLPVHMHVSCVHCICMFTSVCKHTDRQTHTDYLPSQEADGTPKKDALFGASAFAHAFLSLSFSLSLSHTHTHTHKVEINKDTWGWEGRDGLAFKSSRCSSRRPGFNSQPPHGGSQPSVTSVPGNLTASDGVHEYCTVHIHMCRQAPPTHKNKINQY